MKINPNALWITYFEPFLNRPANQSQIMANLLKNHIKEEWPHFEVTLYELPVVYDVAAQGILQEFESQDVKPIFILSLGEANGDPRFEKIAHNRDHADKADNEGDLRLDKVIIDGAPPYLPLHSPTAPEGNKEQIGGYVCNNTAFRLAHALQGTSTGYSFVHIPQGASEGVEPPLDFVFEGLKTILKNV